MTSKYAVAHAHYGIALHCLQKVIDDKGTGTNLLPISNAILEVITFSF